LALTEVVAGIDEEAPLVGGASTITSDLTAEDVLARLDILDTHSRT
jgi:hypothetical protein